MMQRLLFQVGDWQASGTYFLLLFGSLHLPCCRCLVAGPRMLFRWHGTHVLPHTPNATPLFISRWSLHDPQEYLWISLLSSTGCLWIELYIKAS
jgi:hypothetical protein